MDDVLIDLNPEQRRAVVHGQGPLLIVAGAGTGKTTVLTRRYVHLLRQPGMSTTAILALTFTEKAATEMEDRVIQLLPSGSYDFWISTFHGFCQRVLEAHGLEIGLPNQFKLLTPTDAWLLLKRRQEELPLDHYRPLGNPVRFLRALLQHLSRAKDEGITADQYQLFVKNLVLDGDSDVIAGEKQRLQELADVYSAYRRILLEEGCLDFGDLILETLRLFQQRPAVLAQYQKQFRAVMVDEFQDTNWAQYELLKLLTAKDRALTVVGDDDQAIYKFRGASLANILQFRDDFPDAATVALTKNYRSYREVLDLAYGFIKRNDPNRLEVRLKDTGLTKQLEAMRGEGARIELIWKSSVEEEAEAVVERIASIKRREADASWNDFAVLVRSNDGAEPFVMACERADIPFQFYALRGLYAKPVVVDLVALLSLLDGYHEAAAVWRALSLPCYGFPAKDVSLLLQYAQQKNGLPLWLALREETNKLAGASRLSDEAIRIGRRLVADVDDLVEQAKRASPLKVMQTALEKSGYLGYLMRLPEGEKRESIQWLNAFADRVKRYEASTHGPSLRGFLEEFRLEIDSGEEGALAVDPEAGPELVKILTVHAAKGLEFKHVFIVSMVDQRFPSRGRPEAIPLPDGLVQERLAAGDLHLEEERRLFYVALTRAKNSLTLSGASHYGGSRGKKPSSFLAEAGLEPPSVDDNLTIATDRLAPPKDLVTLDEQHLSLYSLKRRFSFTQLAAFRKCPLQYKLAHIYRIPVLGNQNKAFGNSMHLTFQYILQLHLARAASVQASLFGNGDDQTIDYQTEGGFRVKEDEALRLFEQSWQDTWYDSPERHDAFKALGRKAVKRFWQACAIAAPTVFEIEREFTLVLGEHSIRGKIDRVDRLPDGSLAVFDYKTGEAKQDLNTEAKEQLHLYQIALEERGLRVGRLAYVYVLDWTVLEVEPLKGAAREKFIAKMSERMGEILRSDFSATPDPHVCNFCDFKNICEFRKLSL